VLTGAWGNRSSSSYDWLYLHQGGRYDEVSGLYSFRHRDFSPSLMRWMQSDPIGFGGGDANLYRYVSNGPTNATDPSGLVEFLGVNWVSPWNPNARWGWEGVKGYGTATYNLADESLEPVRMGGDLIRAGQAGVYMAGHSRCCPFSVR